MSEPISASEVGKTRGKTGNRAWQSVKKFGRRRWDRGAGKRVHDPAVYMRRSGSRRPDVRQVAGGKKGGSWHNHRGPSRNLARRLERQKREERSGRRRQ